MEDAPHVVDTSVVLALARKEPISPHVIQLIKEQTIFVSSVNYCEALSVFARWGWDEKTAIQHFDGLEFDVIDFTPARAIQAAKLYSHAKTYGLSLGDRACLALAQEYKLPVLTADRIWAKLDLGIKIEVVR